MNCYRCTHIGAAHRHLPDKVGLRRRLHMLETRCADCTECRRGTTHV